MSEYARIFLLARIHRSYQADPDKLCPLLQDKEKHPIDLADKSVGDLAALFLLMEDTKQAQDKGPPT